MSVRLIRLNVILTLALGLGAASADPDLWGHVLFGRDMFASHGIPRLDPYSFTSDRPWVNHEWLAELAMYVAYAGGGAPGLIALKVILVLATLWAVACSLRRLDVPPIARDLLLLLTVAGTFTRTLAIRPQLFSLLLFALLLLALTAAEKGSRRALAALPLLMVLWVNVHGGWIVGLGVIVLWATLETAGPRKTLPSRILWSSVGTAALCTLINPYGVGMWRFLCATVGFGRPGIQDWQPLWSLPFGFMAPWLLTCAVGLWALTRSETAPRPSHVAVVAGLGLASLRVSRLDAFFCLSVVFLFGPHLVAILNRRRASSAAVESPPRRLSIAFLTFAALASMLAPIVLVEQGRPGCIRISGAWLAEPESTAFITANGLNGRVLNWFGWGEYAIWHFGPRLKVSIDGRRETVYSDELIARHVAFYEGASAGDQLLDRIDPDYIWLPKSLDRIEKLTAARWKKIYEGPVSVILARSPRGDLFSVPATPAGAERCFPGS